MGDERLPADPGQRPASSSSRSTWACLRRRGALPKHQIQATSSPVSVLITLLADEQAVMTVEQDALLLPADQGVPALLVGQNLPPQLGALLLRVGWHQALELWV